MATRRDEAQTPEQIRQGMMDGYLQAARGAIESNLEKWINSGRGVFPNMRFDGSVVASPGAPGYNIDHARNRASASRYIQ